MSSKTSVQFERTTPVRNSRYSLARHSIYEIINSLPADDSEAGELRTVWNTLVDIERTYEHTTHADKRG